MFKTQSLYWLFNVLFSNLTLLELLLLSIELCVLGSWLDEYIFYKYVRPSAGA